MKKHFLIFSLCLLAGIIYFFGPLNSNDALAATRTWSSSGSTDLGKYTNYSGSGPLLTTDDLVFDNTSVVNAAATSSLDVGSVTIASTYTGIWAITGYTLTVEDNTGFSDNGITGAHNYGNGITLNGASAILHIGSGIATPTAGSCALTMNGTTGMIIDNDKASAFKSLTLGASAVVTASSTNNIFSSTGIPLTLGNSSSLTIPSGSSVLVRRSTSGDLFSLGSGYTITDNGFIVFYPFASSIALTVPALTVGGAGTGSVSFTDNTNLFTGVTMQFTGTQNYGANTLKLYAGNIGSQLTFDFNNQSVTCGAFQPGMTVAPTTGSFAINYTGSQISVSSYSSSGTYNNATTENLGTSQWTVSGGWTNGSNHIVIASTSLITFTGTGASTVTSAGKNFYDISVNNASKAFTFADATSLHNLNVTAMTSYNQVGTTLTASGNVSFDGAGTLNLGNGITLNGASAILHIGSGVSTVTAGSCALTMNGTTGMIIDNDKGSGSAFKSLTLGTGAVVTASSTGNYFSSSDVPLTMGDSSSLITSPGKTLQISRSTSGDFFLLGSGYTITNNGSINFYPLANSIALTVPALTVGGAGNVFFSDNGSVRTGVTMQFTGTQNYSTNVLRFYIFQSTSQLTVDFNNQSITCGLLSTGPQQSPTTGSLTINYANSPISITSYSGAGLYNFATTENFQTSQWTVSGNWTFGSNHTINPGTSQVTFTNTASIHNFGKSFRDLAINASGKTITLYDNLTAHNLNITSAKNFNSSSTITTIGGNLTIATSTTFNRLIMSSTTARTITVAAGKTITLSNLTDTNLNGSSGGLNIWRSGTPGSRFNLAIPEPITLTYQNAQDSSVNNVIFATDGTSVDGLNNVNWAWVVDNTLPTVDYFTIPATSNSFTIGVNTFGGSDNIGVTGYLITATSTTPSLSDSNWSSTPQTSFTFSGTGGSGTKTAYAWVRDTYGNISTGLNASVVVSYPGTVYYVSMTDGDDSYDGTEQLHTTGNTGPLKTLAKINSSTFFPGDSILFKRGDTWRGTVWNEYLNPHDSGKAGSPIIYGAYGGGDNPVFDGADPVVSWTQGDGGAVPTTVWYATVTFQSYQITINDTSRGHLRTILGALAVENDWYWNANTLYIYGNPTAKTILSSMRSYGLYIDTKSYITVNDLTFQHMVGNGFTNNGTTTNIILNRCVFRWNRGTGSGLHLGASFITYNNCLAEYNWDDGFGAYGNQIVHDITYNYTETRYNGDIYSNANSEGDGFTAHENNYNMFYNYCLSHHNFYTGWANVQNSSGHIYNSVAYANGGDFTALGGGEPDRPRWDIFNCHWL
jgi:hypothetical protein